MTVEPVFREWLARAQPELKDKIESRLRATRGGKLYETEYGVRMKGRGEIADQIGNTFKIFARQLGLDGGSRELDASQFRPPLPTSGQRWLF